MNLLSGVGIVGIRLLGYYEYSSVLHTGRAGLESLIGDNDRVHAIGLPGEEVVHSAVHYGVQHPVVPIVEQGGIPYMYEAH